MKEVFKALNDSAELNDKGIKEAILRRDYQYYNMIAKKYVNRRIKSVYRDLKKLFPDLGFKIALFADTSYELHIVIKQKDFHKSKYKASEVNKALQNYYGTSKAVITEFMDMYVLTGDTVGMILVCTESEM